MKKRRRFDATRHATVQGIVHPSEKQQFQRICERRGESMSGYLARVIRAAILAEKLRRTR